MDKDPWIWDEGEVQSFFREGAKAYISDRPGDNLPPATFLRALEENEVNGACLLCDVDNAALKDDFNVTSFRVRGTILHCINKLRKQSPGYALRDQPPLPRPLSAQTHIPEVPTTVTTIAAPVTATASLTLVGENVRQGEIAVVGDKGRSRRKLQTLQLVAQDSTKSTSILGTTKSSVPEGHDQQVQKTKGKPRLPSKSSSRHLPALPIDSIFYGPYSFGDQVGKLELEGDVYVDDSDSDEDNFNFTYQNKSPSQVQYVYRQLQHFFHAPEIEDIQKNGHRATAVLPYRKALLKDPNQRSATIFELQANKEISVTRQIASSHDDDSVQDTSQPRPSQAGDDEWDFLLHKYPANSTDSTTPRFESESDNSSGSVTDSSEIGSDECEEEDVIPGIDQLRVAEILDSAVSGYVSKWKELKLPALERKRARTVWNKMKGSRSLRDALIDGALSRIEDLSTRLEKMKEGFINDPWQNEKDLISTCETLEVTVQDREEQRWKISVWQRRQAPPQGSFKKPAQKNRSDGPVTSNATQKFTVLPEDRMSVSPAPNPPVTSEDQYFTPNNSPKISTEPSKRTSPLEAESSAFIEDDDVVMDGGLGADSTPVPVSNKTPPALVTEGISLKADKPVMPSENDSSDDDLPSPTSFVKFSLKKEISDSPIPFHMRPPPEEPIDLTYSSDSSNPPTKKRGRPPKNSAKKAITFPSNPIESTAAEVKTWEYNALCESRRRAHLLIKMVLDWGPDRREDVARRIKSKDFKSKLRSGLQTRHDGDAEANALNVDNGEAATIISCADVFVVWYYCDFGLLKKPEKVDWLTTMLKDDVQQTMFILQLTKYLEKRNSKLFVEHKQTSPNKPVHILDSDDATENRSSPHRKRKRKVELSKTAMDSRDEAKERQKKYDEALAKNKNSDSSKLEALIARDPSLSDIPINPIKDDNHDLIYVTPAIAKKMKAHQIDGVRFLWRELTSLSGKKDGQGCLLAHTMGLGKTMQTIALLVALTEASESTSPRVYEQLPTHLRLNEHDRLRRQLRILVLCPPSLLQNWRREIKMWAPTALRNVLTADSTQDLLSVLDDWNRAGGVLLMGYEAFRAAIERKDRKRNGESVEHIHSAFGPRIDKILLTDTEVVVADEAHHLKNIKSGVAAAASKFHTGTRIGLTGTPMSNNVQEIYSLVSWVSPGYLGEPVEFQASYAEPIQEGTYEDSTAYEVRKSIKKLHILQEEIAPKVNRADITALKGHLKPKIEFVITVPLTELQDTLYKRYINSVLSGDQNDNVNQMRIFSWLAILMLLTNHPRAFKNKMLERNKKRTFAEANEDANGSGSTTPIAGESIVDKSTLPGEQNVAELGFTEENIQYLLEGVDDSVKPNLSAKTMILLDILRLSNSCGDSVIVFSGSIPTLNYLQNLLQNQKINFGMLTGSTAMRDRTELLEKFTHKRFDVMLVSTKAGGVGLNMQVANRVVIFDFGFNPAHEEQAIGRAYRFGQEKPVFVYRFVAGGTFETNLDNRQLFKASLAKRVVDKKNPKRSAQRNTREWLYEPRTVKQENLSEWVGKDPHVLDQILDQEGISRSLTVHSSGMIRAIKTMETLQAETLDAPLTAEELAEVEIEKRDRKRLRNGLRDQSGVDSAPLPTMRGSISSSQTYYRPPPPSSYAGGFSSTQPVPRPPIASMPGSYSPTISSSQVPVQATTHMHPPQHSAPNMQRPVHPTQLHNMHRSMNALQGQRAPAPNIQRGAFALGATSPRGLTLKRPFHNPS